jgi:drug/metabolite transporter (DMT)-like permease
VAALLGEVLSISCALTWALAVILFKRSDQVEPRAMNLFKNVVALGLLVLTMAALGLGIDWTRSGEDWARLLASGVIGIAIADTLFFAALRHMGPGLLAITGCAYAPLVVAFSVMLLGEQIGAAFALGAMLVALGVLVATYQRGEATPSPDRRRTALAVLMALAAEGFMALGVVLAKPALERSDLLEASLVRLVAGTAALSVLLLRRSNRVGMLGIFRPQAAWVTLVPAVVLGTYLSMILWLGGMKYTTASVSSVLSQMSVIFTLVLARLFLGETLSHRRILGGGAALVGTFVILLTSP